jgi:hypothetical protein
MWGKGKFLECSLHPCWNSARQVSCAAHPWQWCQYNAPCIDIFVTPLGARRILRHCILRSLYSQDFVADIPDELNAHSPRILVELALRGDCSRRRCHLCACGCPTASFSLHIAFTLLGGERLLITQTLSARVSKHVGTATGVSKHRWLRRGGCGHTPPKHHSGCLGQQGLWAHHLPPPSSTAVASSTTLIHRCRLLRRHHLHHRRSLRRHHHPRHHRRHHHLLRRR